MRPVLIDTNAYAAYRKGDNQICNLLQHVEKIGISAIVLGELLAGFEAGNRTKKNREELSLFLESERIKVFSITPDTANFYSQIYGSLKKKGKPIPTNDMWIAAQALEHGSIICSFDAHFNEIDGLLVATSLEAVSLL